MLHDIRDFNPNFFPERYKMPYFLDNNQFNNIINNIINSQSGTLTFNENLTIDPDNYCNKYILTFDDGLKDHIFVARKLKKHNIKAVFFIPSGPIEDKIIIDSHKIQFIIASTDPNNIISYIYSSYELFFNKSRSDLDCFYMSKWKDNIWPKEMVFITRILREFDDISWRKRILNELFNKYVSSDNDSFANEFYLNKCEVNEILALGHLIGGHGHYSYDLRFEDERTVYDEIRKMNFFLESFKVEKKYFSYPNGGFNDDVVNELMCYNFKYAFTTGHRKLDSKDHILKLPRLDATKTDLIF